MKKQGRAVQPPRCVFVRRLFEAGAVIRTVPQREYIGVHMRKQKGVCMHNGGVLIKLLGRQEECEEQRQRSLKGQKATHDGLSMYQAIQ